MRRGPQISAALLALCALLLPAPAAGAAQPGGLCQDLRARLVRGGGGGSGLFVLDATRGTPVCGRAAKRRRTLASNMKLFTTATALGRLGPTARIPTRLLASGRLDEAGTLHGDLYLVGGGDPALGAPAFYGRFLGGLGTNLYALKSGARAAGIRAVTGRLYADDSVFDRLRGVADSGYATSPYVGPLSGLAFNSGYASSSGGGFASDPAKLAARKLARGLRRAGISLRPRIARGDAPPDAERIAAVRSPTIAQLAAATNVPSNNFYAEMLIKLLGSRFGATGSTRAGAAVVERFARGHGATLRAADGSGLTRTDRASPAAVVHLLAAMRGGRGGGAFVRSLAVAGRDGTIDDRMRGTAAAGRCRAKTGTLTGVSSLSGYCFNRSGRTMIFSILMNGVRDLGLAHYEQDRIAAVVAAY